MSLSPDEHFVPMTLDIPAAVRIFPDMPSPDSDGDNLYSGTELNEVKKSIQEEKEARSISLVGPNSLIPSAQEDNFNLQGNTFNFTSTSVTEDLPEPQYRFLDPFDLDEYMKDELARGGIIEASSTDLLPVPYTFDEQYTLTAVEDTVPTNFTNAETTQLNAAAEETIQLNSAAEQTIQLNSAVGETIQSVSTVDVSEIASLVTLSIPSPAKPTAEVNTFATVTSNEYGRRESRSRKSSLGSRRVSEEVKDTSQTDLVSGQQRSQRPRRTATKRKRSASPEIPKSSNPRSRNKRMWEIDTPETKNAMLARRRREEQKAKMEKAEADIKSLTEDKMILKKEVESLKEEVEKLRKFKQAHEISQTHSITMMNIIEGLRPVAELLKKLPASTRDANNMM